MRSCGRHLAALACQERAGELGGKGGVLWVRGPPASAVALARTLTALAAEGCAEAAWLADVLAALTRRAMQGRQRGGELDMAGHATLVYAVRVILDLTLPSADLRFKFPSSLRPQGRERVRDLRGRPGIVLLARVVLFPAGTGADVV